jgi:hypothetical protein
MAQNEMEAMGGMPQGVRLSEWLGHDFEAPSAGLERKTAGLRFVARPAPEFLAQVPRENDFIFVFIAFAQTVRHLGSPCKRNGDEWQNRTGGLVDSLVRHRRYARWDCEPGVPVLGISSKQGGWLKDYGGLVHCWLTPRRLRKTRHGRTTNSE